MIEDNWLKKLSAECPELDFDWGAGYLGCKCLVIVDITAGKEGALYDWTVYPRKLFTINSTLDALDYDADDFMQLDLINNYDGIAYNRFEDCKNYDEFKSWVLTQCRYLTSLYNELLVKIHNESIEAALEKLS